MTIATTRIDEIARRLDDARRSRTPVPRELTRAHASLDDGYAVQRMLMAQASGRGAGLRGFKIGVTSTAAMGRAGVDEPLYGFLERDDAVDDAGTIDSATLVAPRIEMELAFVTSVDLHDEQCDAERALAATAYVLPALEIIDSRYTPGEFDVVAAVADNMSTARHVVGSQQIDPRGVALADITATLERNGAVIAEGSGRAVLGDPARSLAWLVRALVRHGLTIPAGSVVLTGGFADALPAAPGDAFVARFSTGGSVACTFSPLADAR